jgi:hypothetical protein
VLGGVERGVAVRDLGGALLERTVEVFLRYGGRGGRGGRRERERKRKRG